MTSNHRTANRTVGLSWSSLEYLLTHWTDTIRIMPLFFVPAFDGTRWAKPVLAPAASFYAAAWAGFRSLILKVFSVYHAVTMNTKGDSVLDTIPQFRKLSEGFDVVGVEIALLSTTLAGVFVALIDSFPPFSEFMPIAGTFIFKAGTIFPGICVFARSALARAFSRAVGLVALIGFELFTTLRAGFDFGRIAVRPALFGAVAGGLGAISLHSVFLATDFAGLCYAVLALLGGVFVTTFRRTSRLIAREGMKLLAADFAGVGVLSSLCHSGGSIPQSAGMSNTLRLRYSVTLQRWHQMTGEEPVLLERLE